MFVALFGILRFMEMAKAPSAVFSDFDMLHYFAMASARYRWANLNLDPRHVLVVQCPDQGHDAPSKERSYGVLDTLL